MRVWTFFLSVSSTVAVSSLLPFRLSPPQSTQMRNLPNYSLYCFQSAPMKHANQHFHCFDLYVNSAFTGEKGTTNFSRLVVDAQNNSTNTDSRAPLFSPRQNSIQNDAEYSRHLLVTRVRFDQRYIVGFDM